MNVLIMNRKKKVKLDSYLREIRKSTGNFFSSLMMVYFQTQLTYLSNMNWIVAKKKLSENVVKIDIKAPEIALGWKPGLYVTVRVSEADKPFPLVIAEVDNKKGEFSSLVHTISPLRQKFASLSVGDELYELSSFYGEPLDVKKVGTVLCVADGVGIVPMLPIASALKAAGNKVVILMGASSEKYLLFKDEMARIADDFLAMTDDGSCGREGMVTDALRGIFSHEKIDFMVAYGPARMIKEASILSHRFSISLIACLYSVCTTDKGYDGTYRVSICPNSKSVCVDGIDFNAFYSNFETMIARMEQRLGEDYEGNQQYITPLVEQY